MRRAALLLVVLVLTGCAGATASVQRRESGGDAGYVAGTGLIDRIAAADRGEPVEFGGPLLDGSGRFDLVDARGEVVVLNVWASWCAPCRKEAPALNAAAKRLRSEGVRFIGVNTKDAQGPAKAFVAEFDVPYPSVYDEMGEGLLAFRGAVPPAALPTTLVIDRQGRVAARGLGELNESTIVGLAEDVLAEEAR